MVDQIDSALDRRLDMFTVAPLPGGFADRLVAQALALPHVPAAVEPGLPRRRAIPARRWWRGGAAGVGMVALGMISMSAAAMGLFGEPVQTAIHRAPVIGKIAERIAPSHPRRSVHPAPVAKQSRSAATPSKLAGPSAAQAVDPAPLPSQAGPLRVAPEARRAWLEAHPRAARRVAERRAVRAEVVGPRAQRMERRARRRAIIEQRVREAQDQTGTLPVGTGITPRVQPEPGTPGWRINRLRALRERRRLAVPDPTPAPDPAP